MKSFNIGDIVMSDWNKEFLAHYLILEQGTQRDMAKKWNMCLLPYIPDVPNLVYAAFELETGYIFLLPVDGYRIEKL